MDSCGIMSMIARATVSPPTPESKTPIGASDIVPHHVAHQRFLEPGERLVQHAQPHPLRIDYRVRGVTRRERMLGDLSLIHISEPTRLRRISYAVFCLKKK